MQKQFDAFANAQLLLQHQYRPALVVLRASDHVKQESIDFSCHFLSTEQRHSLPHIRQNRDLGDNLSYPLLTGVICKGRCGKDVHVFVSKSIFTIFFALRDN